MCACSGAVLGCDICVRKPLVATCSIDKTVRLWNYQVGIGGRGEGERGTIG